jgi:hypothetical protein
MHLEHGDKSVQDYYGELQKGLMRCGIVEGTGDSICHFYLGLRHDIQDIVDYKEFNTVNQLFWLAMFEEKELQGRALQGTSKVGTTYAPRLTPSSGLTRPSSFWAPPPMSKQLADARVATPPKPSDLGKKSFQVSASASSVASTGRTTRIQFHRCLGFGHVRKDCPHQQAYMATDDGYISTSDMEDDTADDATAEDGDVLGSEDMMAFRSIIMH